MNLDPVPLSEQDAFLSKSYEHELLAKYRNEGYLIIDFPDKDLESLATDIKNDHFRGSEIEDWQKKQMGERSRASHYKFKK